MEGVEDILAGDPMAKVHATVTMSAQMEVWKNDGDVHESLDGVGADG